MSLNVTLKDINAEFNLIHLRLRLVFFLMFLLTTIVFARLFYLQVLKHEHFTTLSIGNRVKVVPIAPIRGLIFSRDNILVADNELAFNLEVIPEGIEDLDILVSDLSALLDIDERSINRFKQLKNQKRNSASIPLKLKLSEYEVARFSAERHNFPSVRVTARPYRYYPYKSDLVHVLGYVGRIDDKALQEIDKSNYLATTHIGKLGIEKSYESILHGKIGHQQVEVNAQGRIIRVLEKIPSSMGKNLHLTIDYSLQATGLRLLQGRRGSIVAIDPQNGDVLALVSAPSYDPNAFVNGIESKLYKTLLSSKDTPLINRAINGKYPPGSTIKPFLGLAGLELGIRDIEQKTWCKGWYSLPGDTHRYRDWKVEGHGEVDLQHAIVQSCDVYFYSMAHDLGIKKLHQALTTFGFGSKTGIDLGLESDALVPSAEWKKRIHNQPWYTGETLIAGIGQGYLLVTPLQLATATARLANPDKAVIPRLVYKISDQVTKKSQIIPIKEAQNTVQYKQEHQDYIINAMQDVVHGARGTARKSGKNAQYKFAGKTGTVQVFSIAQDQKYEEDKVPDHLQDHALFIAFAPVDNPQIALAIIIENGGSGSAVAAPIARQLFDQYLLGSDI